MKKSNNMKGNALLTILLLIFFLTSSQLAYGGDVVGKLVTGYQGWFSCANDNSPRNIWVHWGGSGVVPPSPGDAGFDLYPDVREYTTTYRTGFANLGNGQPARLFSSYDTQVVNKHFEWMQEYGIDVAALQRFGHSLDNSENKAHKDGIAIRVKNASETYGRKFYIMYDISDWDNFQSEIKTDWTNTITGSLDLLASSAYAIEDGKPVVCLWGVASSGRPGNVDSWKDVIDWLKDQGCYVIVGGNKHWRTNTINLPAWEAANMISPWHVGTFNFSGVDAWGDQIRDDMAYCKARGIDYMPVTWPGFSWANWKEGAEDKPNQHPRMHGNFIWNQFYTVKSRFNSQGMTASVYVAMFDEYDEGTAIAKAAEDVSMIPTNQWFLTLDADGVHCSSDFYLRITGDGAKMIKGDIPLTQIHPTPHLVEPAGEYLDNCDTLTGWNDYLVLNSIDQQQGSGCLEFSGTSTPEFYKVFDTPYKSGIAPSDAVLKFWYYVSDISKMDSNNQVELGSGGAADFSKYHWTLSGLSNGWNEISLKISDAEITGGTPNLNIINWFRVYHEKSGSVTTRIDGIKIIDVSPTTYALIVDNGSGDGNYEPGANVIITADPAPHGYEFYTWEVTSGSPTFANVNNASTTLTMPSGPVTIIATYKYEDWNPHEGPKIIWVSDGGPTDQPWVDLLEAEGYAVKREDKTMQGSSLTDDQKARLNTADLIIISRGTDSGNYKTFDWNSLEVPLIVCNAQITRSSRWQWFNSTGTHSLVPLAAKIQDPSHPIFDGVTIPADSAVALYDSTSGQSVMFMNDPNQNNGKILAKSGTSQMIVEWTDTTQVYYDATTEKPAAVRMFFGTSSEFVMTADGVKVYLNAVEYMLTNPVTSSTAVELVQQELPNTFTLSQNYPNPFNPTTSINYTVPNKCHVELKVYNVLGVEVASIVDEMTSAGNYTAKLDASKLSSGVYFYRLKSGDQVLTRKMMLMK